MAPRVGAFCNRLSPRSCAPCRRGLPDGARPRGPKQGEDVVKKPFKPLQMTPRNGPAGPTAGGGDPIEILLVEDTEYDARRTMNALKDGKVRNSVTWVKDGAEAVAFLLRQGKHGTARRPELILLDWYLPKKDGWEVLEEIKSHSDLKRIPVVIMTTSDQE